MVLACCLCILNLFPAAFLSERIELVNGLSITSNPGLDATSRTFRNPQPRRTKGYEHPQEPQASMHRDGWEFCGSRVCQGFYEEFYEHSRKEEEDITG